jgi:hypothetical protein
MVNKEVKFKHFKDSNPKKLMKEIQDWINGETEKAEWVSEFHVVLKEDKFHAFVKYLEGD